MSYSVSLPSSSLVECVDMDHILPQSSTYHQFLWKVSMSVSLADRWPNYQSHPREICIEFHKLSQDRRSQTAQLKNWRYVDVHGNFSHYIILAYGFDRLGISRRKKTLLSRIHCKLKRKALKSGNFSYWKRHQIFRKRNLQFQKPYQIVKNENYETFEPKSF